MAGHNATVEDHATRIVKLALDMVQTVKDANIFTNKKNGAQECIEARIGVHTDKAYAGVFGSKHPFFKFFGDAVMVAGDLEAAGYSKNVRVSCNPTSQCSLFCT